MIKRDTAVVRMANKASTDLTGKEGYIAEYDSGLKVSGGTNVLGVIIEGGATESDVAIIGTFDGIVTGKAASTVSEGSKVVVDSSGKIKNLPSTAGTYKVIGVAVESGAADELVGFAPMLVQSVTIS